MELPVKVPVSDLIDTELATMLFMEEVKTYVKRNRLLESNLATIYSIAWGKCSEDMKARLKPHCGLRSRLRGERLYLAP